MIRLFVLVLISNAPVPSPVPDATATKRGLVSTTTQTIAGLKTFVDGGIVTDLRPGSKLMGYPVCSTAPGGPGAVFTFDGTNWCPSGGYADFELAPGNGVGMPADAGCYAVSAVTGAKGEVGTFSRPSAAWVPSADGQTYTQCSSGQLRVTTGSLSTTEMGPMVERATTNQAFYPSDLTQASKWTKTSASCAMTVTGPLGTANSASRCTASGSNATVLQTGIGGTNGTNLGSMILRRATGSGTIAVTMDGSTYFDITSSVSSTRWRRVVPMDTPGCAGGDCIIVPGMKAFGATPFVVGFRIGTSGDALEVWAVQVENITGGDATGAQMTVTSPVDDNSGVRGQRSADSLYYTPISSFVPVSVSVRVQMAGNYNLNANTFVDLTNGTDYLRLGTTNGGTADQRATCTRNVSASPIVSGGVLPVSQSSTTLLHLGCEFISAGIVTTYNRSAAETTTATNGSANPTVNKIQMGGAFSGTGFEPSGVIHRVCVSATGGRCAYSAGTTGTGGTPIVFVGDSIMYGNAGSSGTGTRPPNSLETALQVGTTSGRPAYNYGVGGYRTDQCLATWRNYVRGKGFSTLVLGCGVNSAIQGTPATSALAWSDLKTILDEARADGMRVIPLTILPFGSNVNWNGTRQTYITDINTSLLSYCTTNSLTTCLDEYTAFLGTGSSMSATYDSGDGLHPNAAGSNKLATDIATKSP